MLVVKDLGVIGAPVGFRQTRCAIRAHFLQTLRESAFAVPDPVQSFLHRNRHRRRQALARDGSKLARLSVYRLALDVHSHG